MRQLIVILVTAGLIAYDLFLLNGYYVRLVISETSSAWAAIENFLLGLL